MRVWIMLLLCIGLWSPSFSQAACEECPWPLAAVLGEWRSDENVVLVAREVRRSKTMVEISVQILGNDHRVLARGRAIAPMNDSELHVRLTHSNGKKRDYIMRVDPFTNQLIVDGSFGEQFERCEKLGLCLRLYPEATTRLPKVSGSDREKAKRPARSPSRAC